METGNLWHITLFGPLRITRGNDSISHFRTNAIGILLAYLSLQLKRPINPYQSRSEIANAIWPHLKNGTGNLSYSLSQLRDVLEPTAAEKGTVLHGIRGSVRLVQDRVSLDVEEFEMALQGTDLTIENPPHPDQVPSLIRAADLYTGHLLPEVSLDYINQERSRLKSRYVQVLAKLAHVFAQCKLFPFANEYAVKALSIDPFEEHLHALIVHLFIASKQEARARQHLREVTKQWHTTIGEGAPALLRNLQEQLQRSESIVWPYGEHSDMLLPSMPSILSTPSLSTQLDHAAALKDSGRLYDAVAAARHILTPPPSDDTLRIRALIVLADSLRETGQTHEAVNYIASACKQASRAGLSELAAYARSRQALLFHRMGLPQKASQLAEETLKEAQANEWIEIEVAALSLKAYVLENSGQVQAGLAQLDAALARSKTKGFLKGQITVLSDIARMHGLLGHYPIALRRINESSNLARRTGLLRYVYENQHREALFQFCIENIQEGNRLLETLQQAAHQQGLLRLATEVTHSQGKRAIHTQDYTDAQSYLRTARRMAKQAGLARNEQFIRLDIAFTLTMSH